MLLRIYFRKQKLYDIVMGKELQPPEPTLALDADTESSAEHDALDEYEDWIQRDNDAKFTILSTISDDQRNKVLHIAEEESAAVYWKAIAKANRNNGEVGLQLLLSKLHSLKYHDGESMEAHLTALRNVASQLETLKEPVSDASFLAIVKSSLPPSYDTIKFILDGSTVTNKEDTIARIQREAERRELEGKSSNSRSRSTNTGALAARPSNGKGSSSGGKETRDCYNCGRKGHLSKNCRQPRKAYNNEHFPGGSSNTSSSNANRTSSSKGQDRSFALAAITAIPSDIVTSRAMPASAASEEWMIDSGAHDHFSGQNDAFTSFTNSPISVEIANGSKIISPGYGTVALRTSQGANITLERVRYLPGATMGLLSVKQLASKGVSVAFSASAGVAIATLDRDNAFVFDTKPGTDYAFNGSVVPFETSSSRVVAASTRDTVGAPLMVWHRRLGHISPSTILEIVRKGSVKSLVLTDSKITDCEACIKAKSKKSPFKTIASPVDEVLSRVYMDLGFTNEEDQLGRTVYLGIVDQYSAAKWTIVIDDKKASTILDVFQDWQSAVKRLTNRKVRRLRTDNGGEFTNKLFGDYLRSQGITHERTAAYTPEQNPNAERLNGSTMNLVRAMLIDSKLAKSFWSDALRMATFVQNRTVHPRLAGKTPYEVFTGKIPNVSHLRPFGAVGYAHVPKEIRKKLDDTAVRCILIGYDSEYNYVMYNERTRKTIITRHVTFARAEAHYVDDSIIFMDDGSVYDTSRIQQQRVRLDHHLDLDHPPHEQRAREDRAPSLSRSPSPVNEDEEPPEGYTFRKVGPFVPTPHAKIDVGNIIGGVDAPRASRHRANFVSISSPLETTFARLAVTLDDEDPIDGRWEEDSIFVGVTLPGIPKTFDEARNSPERSQWMDAVAQEWTAFEDHGVLQLAKLPPGARALGTTWVFTKKTNAEGKVERFKARLVAQGFGQRPGIDVNETFAPVARMSTVRAIIALASAQSLIVEQFDFDTAFLNGKMTEDVYIKVPAGYPGKHGPGDVLKLIGSMYGTKQAPREWHRAIDTLMSKRGFQRSASDICLYTKVVNGKLVIIVLYVDDGIIAASSAEVIKAELDALHAIYKLKRLGLLTLFLSLEVDHRAAGIFIHQTKYVRSIVEKFGAVVPSRIRANTPMEDRPSLSATSPPYDDIANYQSLVGALQWAASFTRPDIAVAVRAAAQKVVAPTLADFDHVKRVFLYLSNTVDYGIAYRRGGSTILKAYSDASWADDPESRRSVGGFAMLLAGGVISWRSKQQTLIATSTTESEMIAASDATKEVLSLRKLLADLRLAQPSATTILEDNQACIAISQNPASRGRSKHFDVLTLFVGERVALGDVILQYVNTDDNTADIFTKALIKSKFEHHRSGLGLLSLSSWTRGSVTDM